ncbi:MAG TPA: HU family DNA-binding protein [archaeon]|nr:HU family DNA-binding protein [archaeon]
MAKELFGQFLIRRGRVKQQDIDEALILQEILHDSLGAAALAGDLVTFKDVEKILEYMDKKECSFASAACALKILTREQVEELTESSDNSHFPIGQLLVATTKLRQEELEEELEQFALNRLLVAGSNVTKTHLISRIASCNAFGRGKVKQVLESIFETISRELVKGSTITLKGFGSFTTREYPARKGRNPRTGESISIPTKRVARLRYAKKIKRYVDKGYF